jgi:hypothetical protein
MPTTPSTPVRPDVADDELELPVEEVADRLGLPAAMLIRRIEAGDIPARRIDDETGAHYSVRIADLGTSSRSVLPPVAAPAATANAEPEVDDANVEDIADTIPPPPVKATVELAPIDHEVEGPRAELAMMALDPRELVAGLLDRWERTLEQRIYAEQRQRFEAELTNRQAKVKQLQLELEAARAEHAAALAEKERLLAEKMRELVERERELHQAHTERRRGWLFRR